MLGPDVNAVGLEVVEVGARRGALCGGIPPVSFGGDVSFMVYAVAVAVVDSELVRVIAVVFYQSADDKAVVRTIAVGCHHVGVGECGVAVVAVPEDE